VSSPDVQSALVRRAQQDCTQLWQKMLAVAVVHWVEIPVVTPEFEH
jgi:hypothetical protein